MSELPQYEIKDIKLAPEGHHKIDWAYRNMGGYWCYVGGWDNPDYEAQLCGWSGLC